MMNQTPGQIAMQALINDKALALQVYAAIPQQAMYMRMNRGWGMFYIYQGEEKQGGKFVNNPHRYLRHSQAWVALSAMQGTWAQFVEENAVFSVFDFKLDVAQAYTVEVLGDQRGWEIIRNKPEGSTYYNLMSGKYHRTGPGKYTQIHRTYGTESEWVDSTHLNEKISERFIDLEKLFTELQTVAIIDNYTAY